MPWRVWIFGATVAVVVVVAAATVQTVPVSPSTPSQRKPTQAKANVQQKNRRVRRENAEDEEHVCRRHFGEWMHRHKRVYRDGQDMSRRYAVYRAHWKYIRDWNTRKDAHDKTIAHLTFRLGQNQFCDHSVEEFKQRMGYRPANYHKGKSGPAKTLRSTTNKPGRGVNAPLRFSSIYQSEGEPAARSFPASGNWADDKTVVGPIRMQGACGSCWSLATATVVESASAILTGEFVANSAQHLLDCCSGADWWPNEGCNGGNMMTAYRCAAQKGVCEWDDYPYTGVAGTCRACYPVAWISGARLIGSNGDESPIAAAIAGGGPVVVAITASIPTFQFYASGVYNDVSCPSTLDTLDHAVVLTGYGIEAPSQPYWWLRNTWGVEWGEQGYMRLHRGTNLCGVASEVTQPIAKRSDDPSANALRRQMAQKALRAGIQNDPSQSAVPSEELDFGANQPEYVEAAPR